MLAVEDDFDQGGCVGVQEYRLAIGLFSGVMDGEGGRCADNLVAGALRPDGEFKTPQFRLQFRKPCNTFDGEE